MGRAGPLGHATTVCLHGPVERRRRRCCWRTAVVGGLPATTLNDDFVERLRQRRARPPARAAFGGGLHALLSPCRAGHHPEILRMLGIACQLRRGSRQGGLGLELLCELHRGRQRRRHADEKTPSQRPSPDLAGRVGWVPLSPSILESQGGNPCGCCPRRPRHGGLLTPRTECGLPAAGGRATPIWASSSPSSSSSARDPPPPPRPRPASRPGRRACPRCGCRPPATRPSPGPSAPSPSGAGRPRRSPSPSPSGAGGGAGGGPRASRRPSRGRGSARCAPVRGRGGPRAGLTPRSPHHLPPARAGAVQRGGRLPAAAARARVVPAPDARAGPGEVGPAGETGRGQSAPRHRRLPPLPLVVSPRARGPPRRRPRKD